VRENIELAASSSTTAHHGHIPADIHVQTPQSPKSPSPISSPPTPKYAALKSNPHAERAMANPSWRAAHTSMASDFIEGYYKNSRLHHLSMWKAELRGLVAEAVERAERGEGGSQGVKSDSGGVAGEGATGVSMLGAELVLNSPSKGKGKARASPQEAHGTGERVIMHCDFDCFFVSAGLVSRPHLRGKPVVVCHSQGTTGAGSSTSEIASASYEARAFGVRNGMRCVPRFMVPFERSRMGAVCSRQDRCVRVSSQSPTSLSG
jgi:DNA repair protein REV1